MVRSARAPDPQRVLDLGQRAWHEHLAAALAQGRADLTVAHSAEVVFVRYQHADDELAFLDRLQADARDEQWVTARIDVFPAHAFDTLDGLVRAAAHAVRGPEPRAEPGLLAMLEAFEREHRRRALEVFDARLEKWSAYGDLTSLCRAYLDEEGRPARQAARIEAWLQGTETARLEADPAALSALSPRTAKRTLAELSRLVRVLGYPGLLLVFDDADVITRFPPTRRENAYTVLRELIDNADGAHGMVSTQIVVAGRAALFEGPRSLAMLPPLATRIEVPESAPGAPPPPHRPLISLDPPPGWTAGDRPPRAHKPAESSRLAVRAIIRAAQGLPAIDPVVSMSVGHERIDATIEQLFEHAAMEGSVFALVVGEYGSGKTHLLIHLAARALEAKRPVLRLSLERLDADLGNPQRHLRRLLEQGMLPRDGNPSPSARILAWVRSPRWSKQLIGVLQRLADGDGDSSSAARRALRVSGDGEHLLALERFFLGADLESRPGAAAYRKDAYARLSLWFDVVNEMEGCAGPVLIIDEAENLYRGGTGRAERRTALRSLAFYCGGALPRACVVLAITPDALRELKAESAELLSEIEEQKTVLPWEEGEMLRRRLRKTKPIEVPALTRPMRALLAARLKEAHAEARGRVSDRGWAEFVNALVASEPSPRALIRALVDRLERNAFV